MVTGDPQRGRSPARGASVLTAGLGGTPAIVVDFVDTARRNSGLTIGSTSSDESVNPLQ